jgi:hypothetical protein
LINASFVSIKESFHDDKSAFIVHSDPFCILNASFVVQNATFAEQKASFILSNATFVLLKSSLIIDAATVVVQSDAFVHTNAAFIEHKASFCIQEDAFVLLEASCVTQRATNGSHEAPPGETGVALGGAAAAFVEPPSAWRPSPWGACEPNGAFEDDVVLPHHLIGKGAISSDVMVPIWRRNVGIR